MKGLWCNWFKKGQLVIKKQHSPQHTRKEEKIMISLYHQLQWSSPVEISFLKTAQLANILSVRSEWAKDASAVSPIDKNGVALG